MKKRICFSITVDGEPHGMSIELELKDSSTYDPTTAGIDKKGLMELIGFDVSEDQVEVISPEQFDAEFSREDMEEFNA